MRNVNAIAERLSSNSGDEFWRLLDMMVAEGASDSLAVDVVVDRLKQLGELDGSELRKRLSEESPWNATPFGRRLSARIQEARRDWPDVIARWTRVVDSSPDIDHEALLARSRARWQMDDATGAFADLRSAITGIHEFDFLSRAAKLYRRWRQKAKPPALRSVKIALLSSTTTAFSAPLLELACFRDSIDATLYDAPFGNFQQQIIDPNSELYAFAPEIVVIATHWRDANLPAYADDWEAAVKHVVAQFRDLWDTLLKRNPCRIIQHNFDQPLTRSYGHLSHALAGGRAAMLREINRQMLATAPSAVTILDLDHLAAASGASWNNSAFWHLAKQHPASGALPLLVDHQAALVRAHLGLAKKVLAFDLDNTLWGGVIGEDGLEEIEVGPPSAAGEAYLALQQYAKELKSRGILLVVCSKNNEADARLPFEKHDGMLLRLDDFALFRANWDDKPSNLRDCKHAPTRTRQLCFCG